MSAKPMLEAAQARRSEALAEIDELYSAAKAEKRDAFTEDESAKFEDLAKRVKKLEKEIATHEAQVAREEKAAAASAPKYDQVARVGAEPGTYRPAGYAREADAPSFFRDLAAVQVPQANMPDRDQAEARLRQATKEALVDYRDLDAEQRGTYARFMESIEGAYEQRVNPNTTAGTGGEFVPPLWLVSQYVPYVRPTRICANRVRNLPLPPGIDIINLPKITTGSLTGIQYAQGGAVNSQDIVTSTVSAKVNTISGQEDISVQLLEQSPLAMDGVIFDDLSRDYDLQLDKQVLAGTGGTGQHQGVLTLSGATSNTSITNSNYVTVSSATFHDNSTSGTQYRSLLNGVNQIETLRYDSTNVEIWVHPRRENSWKYSAVDSTYRLLYTPYSSFNALGQDNAQVAQGVAGEMIGRPVIKDANIPTTSVTGAVTGGTADVIGVVKVDDLILWEGTPRFRALPEILSGTLQIRYQMYCYSAFLPSRFPPSVSILTGTTGLAAPGF